MIKREDFEEGVADYDMAALSTSLSQEPEYAPPAAEGETISPPEGADEAEKTQVAGFGTSIVKGLFGDSVGGLMSKNSADLVKNKPAKPEPESTDMDKVSETLSTYAIDKEIPQGFVGPRQLSQATTSDEVGSLVEQMGSAKVQGADDPRLWSELRKRTATVAKVMDELRPITEGRQGGVLTDVQMTGVSRVVATAFEDVDKYMKLINEGDQTPETLLRLQNAKATYEVMHSYLQGNKSEVARSLNSIKMMSKALDGKDMKEYERMLGGDEGTKHAKAIKQWAKIAVDHIDKTGSISKFMKFSADHLGTPTRIAVEIWKNNQLSGLGTHVVNNASIAVNSLYNQVAVKPLASAIGYVRTGGKAGADRVYGSENIASLYSSYAGVRGSVTLFMDAVLSNTSAFRQANKQETGGALTAALGDSKLGKTVDVLSSASFRVLSATDDAWRGVEFTRELYSLASRQASKEGLTGKAHIAKMNELIEDPSYDMYEAASLKASQMTFTDVESMGTIAAVAKYTRGMVGEIPALQFLIPYTNTPTRLLHASIEMSPLAPFSKRLREDLKKGGAAADMAAAKITSGMGMGVVWWQLYEAGLLTGGGPDDYKAQQMLEKEGWQKYSIKSPDGKLYGMERMDPLGGSMKITESIGTVIGLFDKAKYAATEEDKEKHWAAAAVYLASNMMDPIWMGQAKGFLDAVEGVQSFEKWGARTAAGFVPYHAALKSIKQFTDSTKPKVANDKYSSDFVGMTQQYAMGNLPEQMRLGSGYVRVGRYWDGSVVTPDKGSFAHAALPWGPTTPESKDPATKALFQNGVIPAEPSSVISIGAMEISLLQLDDSQRLYDSYIRHVGEQRKLAVDKTMSKNKWATSSKGPNGERSISLQKAVSAGKKAGLKEFLKDMEAAVENDPFIYSTMATQFGTDPKAFIKEAMNGLRPDVKGKKKGQATRSEYDYPIPEMN